MTFDFGKEMAADARAARVVARALECTEREYPNHPQFLLSGREDLRPPSEQTPVFFGCFDWHSAVHSHWLLARMARVCPSAEWAGAARDLLERHLTRPLLEAEHRYLSKPGREGFERPYGLAWLLRLAAELIAWEDERARGMEDALAPLANLARDRMGSWLRRLSHPIRSGEHSQTAFAMGLAHDWARIAGEEEFRLLLEERARAFYGEDRELALRFEPSGHDFLSPGLGEVDLMRRVLRREEFEEWLAGAVPERELATLRPVTVVDQSDGKLAHWDGLNLSRAWMLSAIAETIGAETARGEQWRAMAEAHRDRGAAALESRHYAGTHWLGSFWVFDATQAWAELSGDQRGE